jgi:hypothetical protein
MASTGQSVEKIAKTLINNAINYDSYLWKIDRLGPTTNRMLALAFSLTRGKSDVSGLTKFVGHSAGINHDASVFDRYIEQLQTREKETKRLILPWSGKTEVEARPFSACAEAHVWLELYARNLHPRHYYCVAFNGDGRIAPCCNNCKMWVHSAFFGVVTPNTEYNNRHTYSPR